MPGLAGGTAEEVTHTETRLAFELFVLGRPGSSIPGCYIYTADYAARNLFRSTAVHNTVMVDGLEIHPFDPKRLFLLRDAGQVLVHSWTVAGHEVILDAGHTGYATAKSSRVPLGAGSCTNRTRWSGRSRTPSRR